MGNNNTSNHNNHSTNREVEIEIFNRFSRIAKDKLSSLARSSSRTSDNNGTTTTTSSNHNLKRLDELYQRPEFDAERSVIEEMNNLGLRGGIFCGLACFAVLRMGPGIISRMVLSQQRRPFQQQKSPFRDGGGGSGGYKFDDATPPPTTSPFSSSTASSSSAFRAEESRNKPGLFFRLLRLTLDAFVSLSVGAYASVYFTDTERMMKQFADVPLLPGRSLLSEELCDEFTREFRKFDRSVWDERNINGGRGPVDFRSTIQTFVTNCKRRHLYEEELRKELGGGSRMSEYSVDDFRNDAPHIIPSPGVPSDIFVSLDDLYGEEDQSDKLQDANGMDDFDTYFDDDVKDAERDQ